MSWCEQKYINLISCRLRNFKWKQARLANFSCPYCGDSATKKTRARGYFYEKTNKFFYKCHNCLVSTTFSKFLEFYDNDLYREYCFEEFKTPAKKKDDEINYPKNTIKKVFDGSIVDRILTRVDKLEESHPAVAYLKSRNVPHEAYSRIHFIEHIKDIKQLNPKYAEKVTSLEPRILFVSYNNYGHIAGITARAIDNNPIRYINLSIDDDYPHVFGLERIDKNDLVIVLEGAIDSLFIPNSVAMSCASFIEPFERIGLNKNNAIFVYDNEPRNKDIVRAMRKSIKAGYKVCIWGEMNSCKDVASMVESGIDASSIKGHLINHSYSGMGALVLLEKWKKIC